MSARVRQLCSPPSSWQRLPAGIAFAGIASLTAGGLVPALSYAQDAPSAAEMDWRPMSELPEDQQARLPAFCEGGYLSPEIDAGSEGSSDPSDLPLTASGLEARYEMDSELYLKGDVRLQQGPFSLSGSEARYNQRSGQVSVQGPMSSRATGFLLTGDNANYDTGTGLMEINSATFLLHEAEMRGSATSLARTAEDEVTIRGGELTTCAPGRNDWSIVASDIRLDQGEGVGTAKHVRLEVKDIPVFYWPYASFPIDDRRKTGFLYPSFGSSNAGSGGFLSVPYYLNLAPHYDATITPQYIHGRGLFTEAEGRYLSRWGQSDLQLGYAGNDLEYQDEQPGEDGERWGLDFTTRAQFSESWQGYGDYSVVSDNDYLSDLNRNLDINQTTHLRRRGGVRYSDSNQSFDAYFNGYQTISDVIVDSEKPYSQLPEVAYVGDAEAGPLAVGLESQYTFFYRDNQELTGLDKANGQRFRAIPELAVPMRAIWGFARPSVSLDYTRYSLQDYTLGDTEFDRTVPVAEWDSGLYFDRRSSMFDVPYNQTLEPRLYYAWADAKDDQDAIPDFDTALKSFSFEELFRRNRFSGGDRVGDTNRLTVALTSRFNDLDKGLERARVSLGQVHYFDDREVGLNGDGESDDVDSPLAGELVLRPISGLELRTSGLWEPETEKTVEGRTQMVFHSEDYQTLASVGHSYRRGEFEQSDIAGVVPVTDRVSLIGRWAYDSELDRTVGSLAGLEYNNCCWSVQLVHQNYLTDETQLESRVLFRIELKGLGGSGGSSREISDAIIGFDERERRRYGDR